MEWRAIPGFPGYEVSNEGEVRSYYHHIRRDWYIDNIPMRILRPATRKDGYLSVHLIGDDKKHYSRRIGSLVLLAFVGPRPEKLQVCHKDGNKTNNKLDNLRYDTPQSNQKDWKKHSRGYRKSSQRIFDEETIAEMRFARASGTPIKELAIRYNVCQETIGRICTGKIYKWASGPITYTRHLTSDEIQDVRSKRKAGITGREIARLYGVHESTISLIAPLTGKVRVSRKRPLE